MEKQNFWNDAAKCGAIIGAILAVSMVLETMMTLSGSMKYYALMTVEWIGVVVLHYYLLHRFTRNRSKLYSAEEGFSRDISSCWRCRPLLASSSEACNISTCT